MQEVTIAIGRPPLMQLVGPQSDCVEHISAVSDYPPILSTFDAIRRSVSALTKNLMIRVVSERLMLE